MKSYVRKLCMGICLMVLCVGMTALAAEDTILKGVKIGEVDVSGMTRQEAVKALEAYEAQLGEKTIRLGIGDETVEASLSSFGISYTNEEVVEEALGIGRTGNIVKRYKDQKDLQHGGKEYALSWSADKARIKAYVEENCTQFDREAQNASLSRSNGQFDFVAGKKGEGGGVGG